MVNGGGVPILSLNSCRHKNEGHPTSLQVRRIEGESWSTRPKDANEWGAPPGPRIQAGFGVECSRMNIWLTIRSFIAFYLLAFGLAFIANASQERALVGAFFAAVGLTFFWRLWLATMTGK